MQSNEFKKKKRYFHKTSYDLLSIKLQSIDVENKRLYLYEKGIIWLLSTSTLINLKCNYEIKGEVQRAIIEGKNN